MIESIVAEGERLEAASKHTAYGGGRIIRGAEFELWVGKVGSYLKEFHGTSPLTSIAAEISKDLHRRSYDRYRYLLGLMKAIKEGYITP